MLLAIRGLHAVSFLVLACFVTGQVPQLSQIDVDIDISNITVQSTAVNTCFEVAFTPGCSDFECEDYICQNVNKVCCDRKWNDACVQAATKEYANVCQVGWPDQSNDCFEIEPFGRPGCVNSKKNEKKDDNEYNHSLCEDIVCTLRPECCNLSYDEKCVQLALKECDLPDPKNSCVSESQLPRCEDKICLESVCKEDETCCSVAYGPQCVEIARNYAQFCAPNNALNTCYEKSPFGGCEDFRCQTMVCELSEDCCNTKYEIREWGEFCVTAADAMCKPIIETRRFNGEDCPSGMICSYDNSMANCTQLANQYKNVFSLGNVLGGVYCGNEITERRKNIINCPRGSYCPDPETILSCPAGYFCPYKTQEPWIVCRRCDEGSLELKRDLYGYIVIFVVAVLVAAYIGWGLLNRYNTRLSDHVSELEKRVKSRMSVRRSTHFANLQKKKRNLEKLRPKLELIKHRLAKMEGKSPTNNSKQYSTDSFKVDGDHIEFDATRLFDVLDANVSGDLTFDELNVILGLSEMELREFIRRMNEMANLSSSEVSVTRRIFVKYFLQALTDTSNFNISYEESEAMFDELANFDKSLKEIHMSKFYVSSMSEFLSDSQILELTKSFKILNTEVLSPTGGESATGMQNSEHNPPIGRSDRPVNMLNRRGSLSALRSSRRPSNMSIEIVNQRRKSSMDLLIESVKTTQTGVKSMMVGRELFIQNYPQLLMNVMVSKDEENDDCTEVKDFRGVDLCFKDLSLSIKVGKTTIDVVKKVTGRIRGKTMTALMGGSGAGKTSLLNALCGRAHYGETTGTVYLNGHETDIQKHVDCIGFVPQDDIMYPELTVRENLVFAGKFQLPKGTTNKEIEELADETIANLGLARVAHIPVGDVTRRGVSGGEKKRVNIGIELMAIPSILFLDEPTSGLDASSALLVMKNLNHLVEKDGVTVVSVIHQPRKFIFDLFDSLILLGVGGQLVYHGPTRGAEPYFGNLEYKLPKGESVGDWLIDISSGRLEPDDISSLKKTEEKITDGNCVGMKGVTTGKIDQAAEDAKTRISWLCEEWSRYFNKLDGKAKSIYNPPEKYDLPVCTIKHNFWSQLIYQVHRVLIVTWRNRLTKIINTALIIGSVVLISALDGVTKVANDKDPKIPMSVLVRPLSQDLPDILKDLFAYAVGSHLLYAMKVGIILCILIGVVSTTAVTSKRMEFFREAGSGYDLNAYFFAINIISTLEYSSQVLLSAVFATWIRKPITSHTPYYIHFLMLAWLTVAWSLLFPMICSPDTVVLIAAFFFAFFGLIFSGAISPYNYKMIYEQTRIEVLAGWISPTRFFVEGLVVGEYRCMPEQSGFTIETDSFMRTSNTTAMSTMGLARHDLNAVRKSCNGWYWSVPPVILIGFTIRYLAIGAMHACFRAQQAKKPLIYVMKRDRSVAALVILYCIGFLLLVLITTWLFLRDRPFVENRGLTLLEQFDRYGFFD